VVLFSSSAWNAVSLSPFLPAGPGQVPLPHLRLDDPERRQAGHLPAGRRQPWAWWGGPGLVGYFDAPPQQAGRSSSSSNRLSRGGTIRLMPYGVPGANTIHKIGADKYDGPGLNIEWIEVEGPLHDIWPPREPSPDLRRHAASAGARLQQAQAD